MSDPRFTDPRFNDPRLNEPVLRRGESVGGVWGWIAGLAVLALIAFVIIAGWNSNTNTANNGAGNSPPMTTGSSAPTHSATPPSTTGSGATSPAAHPLSPPPAKSGTQ
jgi:hypothetical protein